MTNTQTLKSKPFTKLPIFLMIFSILALTLSATNAARAGDDGKKGRGREVSLNEWPSDSKQGFESKDNRNGGGFPPIWDQPVNTGDIHGVIVMLEANPRINNIPIEQGDYIGGFFLDENGNRKCGGADFWKDTENIIFPLFKDNTQTPNVKEGFAYAEVIQFRIFSWTTMKDYVVDVIAFDTQNYPSSNKWYPLGLSCITNMQALETLDFYISASQNPICIGNQIEMSGQEFIGTGGPYTFNWSSDPPGFNYTVQYPPATNPSVSTTYFLNVSSGSLQSNHQLTIYVNEFPEAIAGPDGTICSSENFAVTGTANNSSGIFWSTSGDGTFNNNTQLNTNYFPGNSDISNGVATLTLNVSPLNPCLANATDNLTVHVIAEPIVNCGPDISACGNDQIILDSQAQYYAVLEWTTTGNGTFSNPNNPVTQYFPSSTDISAGYVFLTATATSNTGCTGNASDQVKISFLAGPTCNCPSSRTKCENQPIPTSGTASNYSSILWTTAGDGTFANPNVFNTNYYAGTEDKLNGQVALTLNAIPISPCQTPATKVMMAYLAPLPTVNTGNTTEVCKDSFLQLAGSVTNAGNVLWTTQGDGTFTSANTLTAKYYPGNNDKTIGHFTLVLTASAITPCATSVSETLLVTVHNNPAVNISTSNNQTVCEFPPFALASTASSYSGILWSTSGDGTFDNPTQLNTNYNPGNVDIASGQAITLTLTASPVSPCLNPVNSSINVSFVQRPDASAGNDATICQTASYNLNGVASHYSSVLWTTSGNGTFSSVSSLTPVYTPGSNDINSGNVTLTLTASAISPCVTAATDNLLLTIRKSPQSNAGSDATVCQTSTHILAGTASNFSTIVWSTSGNGTFSSTSSLTAVYTPGTNDINAGNVTLTLTAAAISPCQVASSDTKILVIQKTPQTNAGNDATICETDTHTLNGTMLNASSITWLTSGDGTFSSTSSLTAVYTPGSQDKITGLVTLTLTASAISPCQVASSDTKILVIQKTPQANAGNDATICETNTHTLSGEIVNAANSTWSTSGDGTFSSTSSLTPVYTPGANDINAGNVTLTLTASAISPCQVASSDTKTLVIQKLPQANAGIDATICQTSTLVLNGSASNYSTTAWSTSGNGTFSSAGSLNAVYTPGTVDINVGTVTLTLTASAISPCQVASSDTKILVIQKTPQANAGNDATICETNTHTLSGEIVNAANSTWSTSGDGTFSSTSSLTPVYTPGANDINAGNVTLTLTASAISPCQVASSDTKTLVIQKLPQANAGIDATICQTSTLVLNGSASNYSTTAWSTSGNGTFSSAGSLNAVYTPGTVDINVGTVTLTLTASAISPCQVASSDTKILVIQKTPQANAGNDATICETNTHTLNGEIVNAANSIWSTSGDGTFSSTNTLTPVYTPGANDIIAGNVTLTLTASAISPCQVASSDTKTLVIQKLPQANAGSDATICQTSTIVLAGSASNAGNVLWSTSGDGSFSSASSLAPVYTPGINDINSGLVTLTLTASAIAPCQVASSDSKILVIQKAPFANSGNDATICQTETHTLSGNASNYSNILWTSSGNGTFTSTSSLTTVYTPGSSDINNGTVTLTLTAVAISPCAVSAADTKTLIIQKLPTVNAGADATICQTATHTLSGTAANQSAVQWTTSGNGTFSSSNSLATVYTPGNTDITNGSVTLTLSAAAISPCTLSMTDTKILTIQKSPQANAGTDATLCQSSTHSLSGVASNYSSVLWTTSGNGTFSATNTLTSVYTPGSADITNGTVTLTLTASAISPCLLASADTKIITIQKSPTANAGSDASICQNSTASLTGTAQNYSGLLWTTSGNGTFSSSSTLSTIYTPGSTDINNGNVSLTLTATAISPCTLSFADTKILTIRKSPQANAGADATLCQTSTHSLSGVASNYSSVLWTTSGNGTFSSTNTLTSVYTPGSADITNGTVILTLTASAISPCVVAAADTKMIAIQKSPTANAGSDASICQNSTASLTGSAQNYSALLWTTAGDGTFSSTGSLTSVYTPGNADIFNGNVTLTLTAAAISPCSVASTDEKILNIQKTPLADAGADAAVCAGSQHQLSATASNYSSVLWTTSGNGTFSSTNSLTSVYTPGSADITNGTVTLTLTASAISPCLLASSDSKVLSVQKEPLVNAGPGFTICENSIHYLSGVVAFYYTSLQWSSSGDGTFNNANIKNPVYTPGVMDKINGSVQLTLTANPLDPCTVSKSSSKILTISKNPMADAGQDVTICQDAGFIQLSGNASNYSSLIWRTNGDGTFSNPSNLNPVYTPGLTDISNGNASLTLRANASTPCTIAAIDVVIINIQKQPEADAGDDAIVCETNNFNISNSSAAHYSELLWETSGDGIFDNETIIHPVYTPGSADIESGSVTLTITANALNPCTISANDNLILQIEKTASASAGEDAVICETGSFYLSGANASNFSALQWHTSGDGYFDDATMLNPEYTPGNNDIAEGLALLSLTATSNLPCEVGDFDVMELTVQQNPQAFAGDDHQICENQTYQTSDASAAHYESVAWTTNGDGVFTNSNSVNAIYTPGQLDLEAGNVDLTLVATAINPCSVATSDTKILSFTKLPVVDAGNDVTACDNVTLSGTADFYSEILWLTAGDGTFSSTNSLNTIYTPGTADINNLSVELTLQAMPVSPCALNISDQIIFWVDIPNAAPNQLAHKSLNVGESLQFNFEVQSISQGVFTWYLDGEVIEGQTGEELNILNVKPSDAGAYNCVFTTSCGNVESNSAFVEILQTSVQELIIPHGWSGISSFVLPENTNFESVFSPVLNNVIRISDYSGNNYFVPGGVNTLGSWSNVEGYKIKMSGTDYLTIPGTIRYPFEKITIGQGWSLIPVNSTCVVETAGTFAGLPQIAMIKEVSGVKLFWPAMGINTLPELFPGKAYAIYNTSTSFDFNYPKCSDPNILPTFESQPTRLNNNPWSEVTTTPATHVFGFEPAALFMFEPGDIIGAFSSEGICIGYTPIENTREPVALSVFVDDVLTSPKDGALQNESVHFKLFRTSTGEEFGMTVNFSNRAGGRDVFEENGISIVDNVEFLATSVAEVATGQAIAISMYPNPAKEKVELAITSAGDFEATAEIVSAGGQLVFKETFYHTGKQTNLTIDLADFPKGVYFMKIVSEKTLMVEKLIIE